MPGTRNHAESPAVAGAGSPVTLGRRYSLLDWPRGWAPDFFLLALTVVVSVLTYIRIQERIAIGPGWDTYAFLDNAAEMAGRSVGYVEPHRPPVMAFLTSLLFRVGVFNVSSIQVLDGALTAVGVIAFYLLLRRRFERPLAMIASVLLVLAPAVWNWLGSGYTDFPSVAFSICALVLAVKATEDDPRWYLIALPMVLGAILTRFGAFLMVVPVALWFSLRARPFKQAKYILAGLGVTGLAYIPAGIYYYRYFSDPFFPFGFAGNVAGAGLSGVSKAGVHPTGLSAIPGSWYVRNAANLLFRNPSGHVGAFIGLVILGVTVIGLLVAAGAALWRQHSRWRVLAPLAAAAFVLLTEWRGSTVLRVGAMALLGFVVATCLIPREREHEPTLEARRGWHTFRRLDPRALLALDSTIMVWGLLFFDAHGHMQPQIDRYFITMVPAALYFVTLGWRALGLPIRHAVASFGEAGELIPHPVLRPWMAWTIAALGLASLAILGAAPVARAYSPTTTPAKDPTILGAEKSAGWLLSHDRNIRQKAVYSDVWPLTSWYLGAEALPMPTFESAKAFPHELEKNRVEYYVTIRPHRYPGYRPVFNLFSTTVLQYQSTFPRTIPAILYFGDGWDAYLEQLCNFDFNLYFSNRRQVGTGTWMIDAMSAQDLAKYDAVAIFGAHWRSKAVAEQTLRTYVKNGGTVIIDASHNMDGFSYPLVDTVFTDVLVRRRALPASVVVSVTPALAQESCIATSFAPTPLVDENGGPWFGASYDPAAWSRVAGQEPEEFDVVASVGSAPVILQQRFGKGRIYWVAANLFWHAYLEGNQSEVRLTRGLLRDAVGLPPIPAAEVAPGAKPWFISRKLRNPLVALRPKRSASSTPTAPPPGSSRSVTGAPVSVSSR